METTFLFVYGTLQTGYAAHDRFVAAHLAAAPRPAAVRGHRLFDAGTFPVALATGDPTDEIKGQLLAIERAQLPPVLAALDAYEHALGANPLYHRVIVPVSLPGESEIPAWFYCGDQRYWLAQSPSPIASGDWRSHQAQHR